MITSRRPVYCALYFVLVVLASAALFLLLEAEFMAFALVIVYAGAILITYLFVLMLAQQAPQEGGESAQAEYDVNPREPLAAVLVGFILMAVLGDMVFAGPIGMPRPRVSGAEAAAEAWRDLAALPGQLRQTVAARHPNFNWPPTMQQGAESYLTIAGGAAFVTGTERGSDVMQDFELGGEDQPTNVQRVGVALVRKFPVSLELAGVILLMAMFGAVILARRQIELGEDEKRAAAGLRRLGVDRDDEAHAMAGGRA
jgi:NADH-quinone oxidoreductase subunit J